MLVVVVVLVLVVDSVLVVEGSVVLSVLVELVLELGSLVDETAVGRLVLELPLLSPPAITTTATIKPTMIASSAATR